jgi:hypothetical protein
LLCTFNLLRNQKQVVGSFLTAIKSKRIVFFPILAFVVAMLMGPYFQLGQFRMLPGDIGDSRLCNYFLENIYLYFSGKSPSLIDLSFFYPYPYVLGFSENLFGSFPVYLVGRLIAGKTDLAFQFWYLASYVVNYTAAYYSLRKLDLRPVAAIIGALIFAFALPISAQTSHVQLSYRFGVPLAITSLIMFLRTARWAEFLPAVGWFVWQFYCSIYIGFFLLLMLGSIVLMWFLTTLYNSNIKIVVYKYFLSWEDQSFREKIFFILTIIFFIFIMALLLFPYLKVGEIYGAKRQASEIFSMLPQPGSYLLMDESYIWKSFSRIVSNIPMRHEHQIFIGLMPLLLTILGIFYGILILRSQTFFIIFGSLLMLVALTLNLYGWSLWGYLVNLPLFSAIRAVTRIILVSLFPIAYLSGLIFDRQFKHSKTIACIVILLLIVEASLIKINSSSMIEWRQRVAKVMEEVPHPLDPRSILFFAQRGGGLNIIEEIDFMWASLNLGVPTLNGYSGMVPPGYGNNYGVNCDEITRRIAAYVQFMKPDNPQSTSEGLISRIVPIGFGICKIETHSL